MVGNSELVTNSNRYSGSFDPYDKNSYYFKNLTREEADRLLHADGVEVGTFLIRDSTTYIGDYSLAVRETVDGQIRHYLIKRIESDNGDESYQLGDMTFRDLGTLLNHYKMRLLDGTSLRYTAHRPHLEQVLTLYRFDGDRESDLSFERNERLTIIGKPEPQWWLAENAVGTTGMIPATYVRSITDNIAPSSCSSSTGSSSTRDSNVSNPSGGDQALPASGGTDETIDLPSMSQPNNHHNAPLPIVPAWVRVTQERQPNAYDKEALRLRKGQLIYLTKILPTGTCEGTLDGKRGLFPFNYVKWTDEKTIGNRQISSSETTNIDTNSNASGSTLIDEQSNVIGGNTTI